MTRNEEVEANQTNSGQCSNNDGDVEMTAELDDEAGHSVNHQASHENAPARRNRNCAPFSLRNNQVEVENAPPQMWDEMVNGLYIETQESSRPLIHYQPQHAQPAF